LFKLSNVTYDLVKGNFSRIQPVPGDQNFIPEQNNDRILEDKVIIVTTAIKLHP